MIMMVTQEGDFEILKEGTDFIASAIWWHHKWLALFSC
jgi:hypothetical protein